MVLTALKCTNTSLHVRTSCNARVSDYFIHCLPLYLKYCLMVYWHLPKTTLYSLSPTAEKGQLLQCNKLHMTIKLSTFFSTNKSPVLPFCSIWLKHLHGFRHQLTDSPEKHTFVMSLLLHLDKFASQNRGDILLPDSCGEDVVLCIFANLDMSPLLYWWSALAESIRYNINKTVVIEAKAALLSVGGSFYHVPHAPNASMKPVNTPIQDWLSELDHQDN